MRKLNNMKLSIALLIGLMCFNIVATSSLAYEGKNEDKIIVEVVFGTSDRDTIANIELDDGTKVGDHEFEVVVKPSAYATNSVSTYFYTAYWMTRDNVVSLSLQPRPGVRGSVATKDEGWSAVVDEFSSDSRWKNGNVMRWQYDCHYSYANTKQYWNLEPSRTASNYLEVVAAKCNP